MKKEIRIGKVLIGGTNKIAIQSMTNTKTRDIDKTVKQIKELEMVGTDIVRVAVENTSDAIAIGKIKEQTSLPIVADIHFDYKLAILSIENGADKIRINPGNIKDDDHLRQIIETAKKYNVPIRIGINSGSLEKELYEEYGQTPKALLKSITRMVEKIESWGFFDIVLSVKSTLIEDTIASNILLDKNFNYPIHIGLTESGTRESGSIRSSYTLGTLLKQNIGNTIRVSLTGNPVHEISVCKEILHIFNLYDKPTLICCPTCGRTNYNMEKVVDEVDKFLQTIHKNIKVAIMGCVVNGPGEARDADIGLAGGNKQAVLFKKGIIIRKIPEDKIVEEFIQEIQSMLIE